MLSFATKSTEEHGTVWLFSFEVRKTPNTRKIFKTIEKMPERIIETKYFKAPISHAWPDPPYYSLYPKARCKFCSVETKAYCWLGEDEIDGVGCIDCLMSRKFSIAKDTEIGEINQQGQLEDYNDFGKKVFPEAPEGFTKEKLKEIIQTPNISTYQGMYHPTHCNDFMQYIGRWSRDDFNKHASDGDGKKLFEEMSEFEEGDVNLWLETDKELKEQEQWQHKDSTWAFGAQVYVFQCICCSYKYCSFDMQ